MPASTSDHDFELNFHPLPLANRIDEVCDQFESAWRSGERPTIGDYLDETIAEHASELFAELVRIDMEYRALHGEIPSYDEYESEYPQFSDVLTDLKREGALAETITIRAKPEKTLGRYELIAEAGGGGFGTVWRAWDTQLKRMVAVKVPRDRLGGSDQEKAFLREARAAAELEHANIVPVLDSGTTDGTTFIVSRFVEGVSLRKWMKARNLTPREIARICEQLAEAVEYAHSKGVIHRDLKPSNVLIDEKGQPHITDFGLATRKLDDVTIGPSGEIVGTPAYMSPEQVRGKPKLDARSDVYSLGVTLYEMLTGRLPFRGDQATVLLQVVGSEPDRPRSVKKTIPVDLETICLKAMEKERKGRYQTAGELAADLRRYLNNEVILGRRLSTLERAWRWAQRNTSLSAALFVSIFSAAISAALLYGTQETSSSENKHSWRSVALTTDPPGARVIFYRLDQRTGEPLPESRIEPKSKSPVEVDLEPDDYFVVASLESGDFHEVYRHVPGFDEKIKGGPVHLHWSRAADGSDRIVLPQIHIPDEHVTDGMVLIEGSNDFKMGIEGSKTIPAHQRNISAFFVDSIELSVQVRIEKTGRRVTNQTGYTEVPPDHALCLRYDDLQHFVESLGKRIPTEAEYELAATNRGQTRFPWGQTPPTDEQMQADGILPLGLPKFDSLETNPKVAGLCSNVAEWTSTYACLYPPMSDISAIPLSEAARKRIVRGPYCPVGSNRKYTAADYDPKKRHIVSKYEMNRGLGVRCVRSARPHLTAEDFRAQPRVVDFVPRNPSP